MKKYQHIVALSCVLVGAIGFGGMYAYNQSTQQQEEKQNIEIGALTEELKDEAEEITQTAKNDHIEPEVEIPVEEEPDLAELRLEPNVEDEIPTEEDSKAETTVSSIKQETLHFEPENGVVWPIKGAVLLDYSMDSTIFFPTLQQYQYNPAMVLSGNVNDKVYFVAKGKITNVETNEETGCTVTQDIGDGYTAVYGQLKELNYDVGDMVQSGQVVGYVNEPTKYYSVEGSNVYFQLLKNGVPIDPEEILP